jgi:spore germination protein KC
MRRKAVPLYLCIVLLTLLTGCWSRRELNDLAIAVAMGIDKDGDRYRVSVQVVNPGEIAKSKGGGTGSNVPVTVFSATGETVFEALRVMTTTSPRQIYLSHLRVLVLGEGLAREGIGKAIDFESSFHEMRSDFFIVVARGTNAENILKITTNIEKIPANHLFSSLETSSKSWAPTTTVTLDMLMNDLTTEGKNPVLTAIELEGDQQFGETRQNMQSIDPPAKLKYPGLAVFKKGKLIGWLNQKESKGYTYIQNKVSRTVGILECPNGGKIAVEVTHSHSKVIGKVENGYPRIEVNIRLEQNIGEVGCQIDLTKQKVIDELDKISERTLKGIIEATIKKMQTKYKVDIFGFGEAVHIADPKAWKKMKGNWNQRFVDLPVHVKVNIKTRRLGTIANPLKEK